MSVGFRQSESPPPPLEHELFRVRHRDGREAWAVLRDVRPYGVEMRQMVQRLRGADGELLWSKLWRYGYSPEDLDDAIIAARLKCEAAGWIAVESARPPEA